MKRIYLWCRPIHTEQGYAPADMRYVHGVEAYNPHLLFDVRFDDVLKLAIENKKIKTSGLDFHIKDQAGLAGMIVPDYINDQFMLRDFLKTNNAVIFNEYLRFGGFPKTLEFDEISDKETYISEVIKQILEKDIIKHKKIRNRAVFDKVMTYIINNFGATVSLSSIAEYFDKQEHIKIRTETLNNYLNILENAKIIYKCPRFDVKSKKSLRGEQKYYLADLGIYFSRNVDARINYGPVLENIVYTYLSAKNYKISVGRIGKLECDFITRINDEYRYVQV